ncbi:hypothetical protein MPTK1_3g04250 [Marchantia polymorpha subsp. ruderalis]|nr:hypothetical protein MARPO_0022s0106 [Marchantia polymorpha]BBN04399.1 hypothetical protein Mp_3g04250 [Marchantia polymorpha subsp. ruderalis]|eukprot:PTQ44005.1 hypothetical protein MARPO_0022s0106 [Marchantia polymorpha]
MAKTKRRQLAALAAKADGKGLTGTEERIASCQEAGPSGTISHKSDPLVEYRPQRLLIKIPALPSKPSATSEVPKIIKRRKRKASVAGEVVSKSLPADGPKRRKRRTRLEMELNYDHVPADNAKISKRRAKGNSTVIPKQAPVEGSRIRKRRASAGPKINTKHVPIDEAKGSKKRAALDTGLNSKQIPADEAKISKVILKLGKWRREKMIGDVRSPVAQVPSAGRQSRTKVTSLPPSRKRVKVQQVPIKSPAETSPREVASRHSGHTPTENGDTTLLVALKVSSGEPVLSSTNRSVEVASTCNGDATRNRATSPIATFRRKRGSVSKAVDHCPTSPKCADRERRSRTETVETRGADGPELPDIQCKKTVTSHPEGLGNNTPSDDISVVRFTTDGATPSGAQPDPHIGGSSNIAGSQQNLPLLQTERPSNSYLQDQNIRPMQHTYLSSATEEEDCKPLWQMEQLQLALPFTPGENGVFLVIKKEEGVDIDQSAQCSAGKDVILSGAELIRQNSQLAIINKRLDAAGGLRSWLLDKGLGQFVPIFDDNKIDSLTLLHITMTGLKEMGMVPVGPRRKFMHALNCLTGRTPLTSVGGLLLR